MGADRRDANSVREFRFEGLGLVVVVTLLLGLLGGSFLFGRWYERRTDGGSVAELLSLEDPLANVVEIEEPTDVGETASYFDTVEGGQKQAEPGREIVTPRPPSPAESPPSEGVQPDSSGGFFVQIAAVRDRSAAQRLIEELRGNGYPVRLFSEAEGRGALYKVREQGLARYIGITSHTDPETLAEALRRYDVDCTQMALNAALQGMQSGPGKMVINPVRSTSFEKVALPVANKKNLGVIAMKVFAQDDIISEDSPPSKLLRYALSLPVSIVTTGVPKHEYLQANLAVARSFNPMPPKEMKEFSHRMAARYKVALDRRFANHLDV